MSRLTSSAKTVKWKENASNDISRNADMCVCSHAFCVLHCDVGSGKGPVVEQFRFVHCAVFLFSLVLLHHFGTERLGVLFHDSLSLSRSY